MERLNVIRARETKYTVGSKPMCVCENICTEYRVDGKGVVHCEGRITPLSSLRDLGI